MLADPESQIKKLKKKNDKFITLSFNNFSSDVPQGTDLGNLFFTIYTNLKIDSDITCFAYGTAIIIKDSNLQH